MSSQSSTSQRLFELAQAILAKSKAGELAWKEANPYAYFVRLGDYYLQVESIDHDDSHPYGVHIEDLESKPLAGLSTADEAFGSVGPANWVNVIAELYGEARRSGSSVERALDEMLDLARKPAVIPPGDEDIPF